MAPANQQIVTAYEECGMSPEDIAQDLGYSLEAVKMVLLQHSQEFSDKALSVANGKRAEAESEAADEPVFTKADLAIAKATIKALAAGAEAEAVRYRASEFIINEVKGRNDLKALHNNNFNVVMIQEAMTKARAAMAAHRQNAVAVAKARVTSAEIVDAIPA